MLRNGESEIDAQLVELIRRRVHEIYYLDKKFSQEVKLDVYGKEHSVEGLNHYIYQNHNWKVNEERDLVFINQRILDVQKTVAKFIIKTISSNIISGKSIMNMSLPV
jgi:hypothetical protein